MAERRWIRNNRISDGDDNIDGSSDHLATGEGAVLRVLLGIAIGVFIYANPEARQIFADHSEQQETSLRPLGRIRR